MFPFCVIPARRGSKRLAEKNIYPLAGRPMLAYTVDAALESGIFPSVVVSTEDDEIARIARSLGAEVHMRPMDLAGDLVSATTVCIEAYEGLENHAAQNVAGIVCLQPSSPLRTSADIRSAWQTFVDQDADYLVSVTEIDPHYFHWALRDDGDDWRMWFGDDFLIERPLLPPVYRPNGAIKIGRPEPLLARRNFFGPRLAVHRMPEERSVHVALHFDAAVAETVLRARDITKPEE
jgi:CMP-N,N'-diacetyllegionaminic acid synthase